MRWPLVGREVELRSIGQTLSDPAAGGVVIAGPAGVGKTRLAVEASELATAQGCAVGWVRATSSAASIPLGAFGALLPAADAGLPQGLELLARARHALAERAAGRRLVLCVDDGQLLDDASAALVHQLVVAGEAFVVVTLRRDEPVADALRALWKDELCELMSLEALDRADVARLVEAALDGPVDGPSVAALWGLTRGNALFLRELVRDGIDRGLLTDDGGVWRWRGEVRLGTRLADLVDLRIGAIPASARAVLEVAAVGAPLELGLLKPDEREALEVLEEGELVQRRTEERRRFVDVAHPLQGEAVRARLTPTRLEAIHTRLADGIEARGARRGGDVLRIAAWRLESGGGGDGVLFTKAAEQALAAADARQALRFARAAVQAGGGFEAELALGRAIAAAGRGFEADELLAGLEERTADDARRAAVAIARARNLFWAADRAADADAALRRAEQAVSDVALRHELQAQRARLTAAEGRPREALAAARPLLDDDAVHERARLNAALGGAEALFSSGRTGESLAMIDAWLPVARRHRAELPYPEPVLLGMRALALRLAGHLIEATACSERNHEQLLGHRSASAIAVEGYMLGFIWLARGQVQTALRRFRESAALLRDGDAVGMLAVALAGVAQALAQAGEAAAARDAVAEMERTPLGHKAFACELGLARAWSAAASGELSRAKVLAAAEAELALSRGQDAYAVRALHELSRLGEPAAAAPELVRLAARVDGPLAAQAAEYAVALAAGDGGALLDVAERFAGEGAVLVAAEAADAAAAAHRAAGRDSSARAAAARAALWLTECEGARPPTLLGAPEAIDLTPREREVALLAAGGESSRDIADRLVVSVRTVDNHLQNAYRKLGVSRRQDLSSVVRA